MDKDRSLTVAAAISLKEPFDEIAEKFSSETGIKVNLNYGASGTLQKQIETGAPVDVFASAGESQMNELAVRGLLSDGSQRIFAKNFLVVIVPKNSDLSSQELTDLKNENFERIAIGNPKTVPAGEYARESLEKAGIFEEVRRKLIFAENVRQVVDYVSRGEVDAGIVYITDSSHDKVRVLLNIDQTFHSPVVYPIAVVKSSENHAAAEKFLAAVLGEKGQAILQKHGFVRAVNK